MRKENVIRYYLSNGQTRTNIYVPNFRKRLFNSSHLINIRFMQAWFAPTKKEIGQSKSSLQDNKRPTKPRVSIDNV